MAKNVKEERLIQKEVECPRQSKEGKKHLMTSEFPDNDHNSKVECLVFNDGDGVNKILMT